jgi:predicted hotdog family 3-hydroxylacyl-ACP dehydratase
MRLDRAWIEAHIPHQGRMCLLDEVIAWNAERISCRSATHRAADHPLRAHGRLGIACGVEYAAQAMAVHAALTAGAAVTADLMPGATAPASSGPRLGVAAAPSARPAAGFLASVRGLQLFASRLDDVQGDLICGAVRVAGDRGTALYEFDVRSETERLLSGRATVVLDASGRLNL